MYHRCLAITFFSSLPGRIFHQRFEAVVNFTHPYAGARQQAFLSPKPHPAAPALSGIRYGLCGANVLLVRPVRHPEIILVLIDQNNARSSSESRALRHCSVGQLSQPPFRSLRPRQHLMATQNIIRANGTGTLEAIAGASWAQLSLPGQGMVVSLDRELCQFFRAMPRCPYLEITIAKFIRSNGCAACRLHTDAGCATPSRYDNV